MDPDLHRCLLTAAVGKGGYSRVLQLRDVNPSSPLLPALSAARIRAVPGDGETLTGEEAVIVLDYSAALSEPVTYIGGLDQGSGPG